MKFEHYPYEEFLQPRYAAWLFSQDKLEPRLFNSVSPAERATFFSFINSAKQWAAKNHPGTVSFRPYGDFAVFSQERFTEACWLYACEIAQINPEELIWD